MSTLFAVISNIAESDQSKGLRVTGLPVHERFKPGLLQSLLHACAIDRAKIKRMIIGKNDRSDI